MEAAKYHRQKQILPLPPIPYQINIKYHRTSITTKNLHIIQAKHQEKIYLRYLQEKLQWTDTVIQTIDWELLDTYINTLTLHQRISFTKFLHKWRPTQKIQFYTKADQFPTPDCPLCGTVEEDDDHPFQCPNAIMRDAQNETLATFRKDLTQIGTYSILTEALIHHIKGWMRQEHADYTHRLLPMVPLHNKLQLAINQQNTIGWDHLICGRLTKI